MKNFDEISIGQMAEKTTVITADLIAKFAELTEDANPVHLDETYAKGTFFGRRVAHGMIAASLQSALLGSELPGPGTIYLSQNLEFKAPVFPEDVVTVKLCVLEKDESSKKIKIRTTTTKQDGQIVIDGTAVVLLRTPRPSAKK
ncbi:MAG: MaoC family dehydratase [Deltaproteobacteria bacterium]|jgi:3-hydroxybutyryl-CoA dehydratase|nr:MaoC family dehydratase [Deltaproteobacteria bacterium]